MISPLSAWSLRRSGTIATNRSVSASRKSTRLCQPPILRPRTSWTATRTCSTRWATAMSMTVSHWYYHHRRDLVLIKHFLDWNSGFFGRAGALKAYWYVNIADALWKDVGTKSQTTLPRTSKPILIIRTVTSTLSLFKSMKLIDKADFGPVFEFTIHCPVNWTRGHDDCAANPALRNLVQRC